MSVGCLLKGYLPYFREAETERRGPGLRLGLPPEVGMPIPTVFLTSHGQ